MLLEFGGVGVNDLVVLDTTRNETKFFADTIGYKFNFALGCAVETAAECCKKSNDHRVGVALHSVEGLDHGELTLPLIELLDDGGEVCHEE